MTGNCAARKEGLSSPGRLERAKRALGVCRYHRMTIGLSVHLVEGNGPEEARETLLHEIAHAVLGPGHGHNTTWKARCRKLGCRPVRCGNAKMLEVRWRAECGTCGRRFHRHRRPRSLTGWCCRRWGRERRRLVWREA